MATDRWTIVGDSDERPLDRRHGVDYLWRIVRGEETRQVSVFITYEVITGANLAVEVLEAKRTLGRSVVESRVAVGDPPAQMWVSTRGISPPQD